MKATLATLSPATLPPAQPVYILRGHIAAIHSLLFLRQNSRLLSGDADGFVVLWSLAHKRPSVVWRAHQGSILGFGTWSDDRIITHGRDGKLSVWSITAQDEIDTGLSIELPVEGADKQRKSPWLLHTVDVNTLNFCAFASCIRVDGPVKAADITRDLGTVPSGATTEAMHDQKHKATDHLLLAVPGATDSDVAIYQLPYEKLVAVIRPPQVAKGKVGMVMAIGLTCEGVDNRVIAVVGYENGLTAVFRQEIQARTWEQIYSSQPHAQPILSLDIMPSLDSHFTSSADAILARHFLPDSSEKVLGVVEPSKQVNTRHAGQQSLRIRSDGKILATAGWDSKIRVYSSKSLKELAVLKWHKEGCYSVAFALIQEEHDDGTEQQIANQSVALTREKKVQNTHWLAAGSKDGKVSLWDIY